MNDKVHHLELIKRSLALKHKLKVYESMQPPETHEELAVWILARWEYEDELHAIEELLREARIKNVAEKKKSLQSAVKSSARKASLPVGE